MKLLFSFLAVFTALTVTACASKNASISSAPQTKEQIEQKNQIDPVDAINATIDCTKVVGDGNANACSGVKSAEDTNAVVSCMNIAKDAAACTGVKTTDGVNAVLACIKLVDSTQTAACSGVKSTEEVNAVLGCVKILSKSASACARR